MKILHLRIKNIHSLKGTHEIDFAQGLLAQAGLFAIVGPTGSGKSTLLDAITLALYNRIPRIATPITKAVIEETGVILTQHTTDCFAEVDFEVQHKKYRAHWSIARNRNNNLNERKHELIDLDAEAILEDSIRGVVERTQQIIGLSYEQFVQSMVLAQGQFAKLLHAPKNERNKLLEEITGAQIYRKIGAAVFERWRQAKNAVVELETRLSEVQVLPVEVVQQETEALKTLRETQTSKSQMRGQLATLVQWRKDLMQLEKANQTLIEKLLHLDQQLQDLAPDQQKLALHEQFVVYQSDFSQLDNHLQNLQATEEQIQLFTNQKIAATKGLKAAADSASQLVQKSVEEAAVAETLREFRNRVQQLLDVEQERLQKAKAANALVDEKMKSLQPLQINLMRSAETLETTQKILAEKAALCQAARADSLEAIKTQQAHFLMQINHAQELIAAAQLWEQHQKNQQAKTLLLEQSQSDLEQTLLKHQTVEAETLQMETAVAKAQENLKAAQAAAGLEGLRSQLQDGQPCPLCGSEAHPYTTHFEAPVLDALQTALQAQQKLLEAQKKELKKLEQAVTKLQTVIQTTTLDIETLTTEKQLSRVEVERYAQLLNWSHEETLAAYQNQKTALQESHTHWMHLEQDFRAWRALQELEIALKNYQTNKIAFEAAKAARVAVYPGKDVADAVQILLDQLNLHQTQQRNATTQLLDWEQRFQQLKTTTTALTEHLNQLAMAAGLEHLHAMRALIMDPQVVQNLKQRLEGLQNERHQTMGALENLKLQLKEKAAQHPSEENLDSLQSALQKIEQELELLTNQIAQIKARLEQNALQMQRAQELKSQLKLCNSDLDLWQTMNDLIGDQKGNKFNNFVQELTLEQLIAYGNRRLQGLTDRYLLTLPKESDGLQVMDLHLGQNIRAVASLSGGETFKISLAMALGLSDLAARNVQIDSLFVDEGFGTLDPDALNDAISVLEAMQHESGKSVGIISHVSELKERIAAKIKLVPLGNGHSRVEVGQ